MSALEERRAAAREAGHDEIGPDNVIRSDAVRAIEAAIEYATRVRIDPEITEAARDALCLGGVDTEDMSKALRAAFEAAGFEVVE